MDRIVCSTSADLTDHADTNTTRTQTLLLTSRRMYSNLESELPPASVLWLAHEYTLRNSDEADVIGNVLPKNCIRILRFLNIIFTMSFNCVPSL